MVNLISASRNTARRGFTLIELLVVIAIIAILAAIIIPAVMAVQAQANNAKDLEQVRGMGNAFTLYYKKYSYFPCLTNMSAVGTNSITVARTEGGKAVGSSLKLLMSGGYIEDVKVFFSPREASPSPTTLTTMQAELDPRTDNNMASTYAYDAGHNPNNGQAPFFGNRQTMLTQQGNPETHVLTCELVAKEMEGVPPLSGTYTFQNHAAGKTIAIVDDIFKDESPTLDWRDSNLIQNANTEF